MYDFSIGFIFGFCICFVLIFVFLNWYANRKKITLSRGQTCTECGGNAWSLLRSINIKKCVDCGHEMPWHLDPGQLPLVRNNRMVKRNDYQKKNN